MALNPQIQDQGTTVKLTWTPDLTGQGYRLYVDGVAVSRTFKPDAASTTFAKPSQGQHSYGVQKMDVVDTLEEVEFPADPDPDPDPDPTPGDDVVLVNQKWSPSGNWGAKNLVDVRILQVDPRRDAVALAGSGTVRKFYGEQHSGDMFKIGRAAYGPITIGTYEEESYFVSKEFYGSVHQDGIQAMGGGSRGPITFVGGFAEKLINGNSIFFANMGSGGQERPTDVTMKFYVLGGYRGTADHGGGRPVRISDSVRCGIRHVLVVYATDPGIPLMVSSAATDPVVEDSYAMTHAQWNAAGQPHYKDLWNANGSHKPLLDQLIAQGKAKLLSA